MKKRLKSYLVFTSLIYRVLMYLGIPVVFAAIAFVVGGINGGGGAVMVMAALLPMVEIISDNWMFGGIQTKDAEKMDFLKTSGCGMNIMRDALCMDLFRKFLTTVVVQGICYFIFLWADNGSGFGMFRNAQEACEALQRVIFGVSASWFFSVLGTFFTRYGSLLWFNVMVGYIMMLLQVACWFLPGLLKYFVIYSLLFVILGVAASMLAVKAAMKKMEGSYYDK